MELAHIGILTAIGLGCGLMIYFVYLKVPVKVKGIEKTEELNAILPGVNCGACGYPGCFAYAQAVAHDPTLITHSPCTQLLQDHQAIKKMEKALGISLDLAALSKKAVVHCAGNSDVIYDYSGAMTCKAASQLLSGYKRCPYACLGLGDCVRVCPANAMSIDPEKNVAVVNTKECTGGGLCVEECPMDIIELVPGHTKMALLCSYKPLKSIPGRERCEYACTHCRKCFNACEDDAIKWDKSQAVPQFIQEKCTRCGKCIEACPANTIADIYKLKAAADTKIDPAPCI